MPTRHTFPTLLLSLGVAISLSSCKGASESCDPTDPLCGSGGGGSPVPTTVTVSPTTLTFTQVGETQQLAATVLDQDGDPITNANVTWSSDDELVATVSSTGLVMAAGSGTATIDAMAGTASGSASVQVDDPCSASEMIALGEGAFGELGNTDCEVGGGFYGDPWRLTIANDEAGVVQIDVVSSEYNTYVVLFDESFTQVAENDDAHFTGAAAYDLSSHVNDSLSAGTYTILVSSASPGETGSYALDVGPGLPCGENGHIGVGGAVVGSLSVDDCSYGPGFLADSYAFEVTSTDGLTIDLTSVEFDTYLTLYTPAGNYLTDDDDSGDSVNGTDSRIQGSLTPTWYVIEVSSFSEGEVGSYTLSIQ